MSETMRASILIVDDEPVGRLALQSILENLGHQVSQAEDGEQALERIRSQDFDCVFMDIQMPRMNGLLAAKTVRNHPDFRQRSGIHIIAMTAYAMEGDRELFLADGMDDYVAKPASVEDIKSVLARLKASS